MRLLPSRTLSPALSARRTSFDPADITPPAVIRAAASSAARSSTPCRGSPVCRTPPGATPASAATRRCADSPTVCTGARPAAPRLSRSSYHDGPGTTEPHQRLPARLERWPLRGAVRLHGNREARLAGGAVRQARLLQGPPRGPRHATARLSPTRWPLSAALLIH